MNTAQDLQEQINALLYQIAVLSGDSEVYDSERVEKYLSEFTQRISVLLTIAALMSAVATTVEGYMHMFLIAVFPLFLMAIFFYLLSARRINVLSSLWTAETNSLVKNSYISVRKWFILTDLALTAFFAAFTISLYRFTLGFSLEVGTIVLLYVLVVLISIGRYLYVAWAPTNSGNIVGVGGTPTDVFQVPTTMTTPGTSDEKTGA